MLLQDEAGRHGNDANGAAGAEGALAKLGMIDVLIILAKHKKMVMGLPLIAALATLAYALYLPNIYTATTKILPPQQNQSAAAAMLSQLGGLAGFAGGSLVGKSSNEIYVAMLRSRTLADRLIERFKLKELWKQNRLTDVRASLSAATRVNDGRDGIITIEVDDESPRRAAELANGYVEELHRLTQVLAVSEASKRRLFFQNQLDDARQKLAQAESAARKSLQTGGLSEVVGQSRSLIEISGRLRGQISAKEVQLAAMRAFAAPDNAELRMVQEELDALRRELARIEGTGQAENLGSKKAASGASNSVQLLRNVKYYETIYELLAKQYELAKVDEARDSALVQTLDAAVEPEAKSRPRRAYMVIIATFLGAVLAIAWALAREASQRARELPETAERLAILRAHLRR